MNTLGLILMSNQYWYGFFIGSMAVIGTATLIALMIRARKVSHR